MAAYAAAKERALHGGVPVGRARALGRRPAVPPRRTGFRAFAGAAS